VKPMCDALSKGGCWIRKLKYHRVFSFLLPSLPLKAAASAAFIEDRTGNSSGFCQCTLSCENRYGLLSFLSRKELFGSAAHQGVSLIHPYTAFTSRFLKHSVTIHNSRWLLAYSRRIRQIRGKRGLSDQIASSLHIL
jgi:hypothetical protein